MPDYASLRSGASVIYGPVLLGEDDGKTDEKIGQLTSETLANSVLPWAEYMLHVFRVPGYVHAEGPDAALSMSATLGSCFAFQGEQGRLTVQLAPHPVMVQTPPSAETKVFFDSSNNSSSSRRKQRNVSERKIDLVW